MDFTLGDQSLDHWKTKDRKNRYGVISFTIDFTLGDQSLDHWKSEDQKNRYGVISFTILGKMFIRLEE